jgi:hypothetical protein
MRIRRQPQPAPYVTSDEMAAALMPPYMATPPPTTNPRKVPASGSTLNANGLIPPTAPLELEGGSSQPVVVRELVPDLATSFQRTQTYAKMMNDSGVDVSMRVIKAPVLGSDFYVDPYSEDPNDLLAAQFIEGNLIGGMSTPLVSSLEDVLKFFEGGWSALEKVYELRQWAPREAGANAKTYTMLKKLAVRPTETVKEIEYDNNGGPVKITQTAIRPGGKTDEVDMDISKLLVFTFTRNGGDLTGKSLLRTAYPHWFYKTHFYKIDAIQKERHSLGIPVGRVLPGSNKNDANIMRRMLRNLRTNEESFALLTPNVELEFLEVKGNLVDVLASANHHNMMILMNVMAQFLALGVESGTGWR